MCLSNTDEFQAARVQDMARSTPNPARRILPDSPRAAVLSEGVHMRDFKNRRSPWHWRLGLWLNHHIVRNHPWASNPHRIPRHI